MGLMNASPAGSEKGDLKVHISVAALNAGILDVWFKLFGPQGEAGIEGSLKLYGAVLGLGFLVTGCLSPSYPF